MPSLRASSRKVGERGVALLLDDHGEQLLALERQDVGHLGRLHVVGAAALGLADQLDRGVEIGVRVQPGAHLHERDREGGALRGHADGLVAGAQQRIELAGFLERVEGRRSRRHGSRR